MGEQLQLTLLGNVEIRREGIPVTGFSSGKALALLCYLAVTGRPHSRPALAGLLWGDLPEANARNNLRKALTHLRGLVGPHLSFTRQTVAFNRDIAYWLIALFAEHIHHLAPDFKRFYAKLLTSSSNQNPARSGGGVCQGVKQVLAPSKLYKYTRHFCEVPCRRA